MTYVDVNHSHTNDLWTVVVGVTDFFEDVNGTATDPDPVKALAKALTEFDGKVSSIIRRKREKLEREEKEFRKAREEIMRIVRGEVWKENR